MHASSKINAAEYDSIRITAHEHKGERVEKKQLIKVATVSSKDQDL